MLRCCCCDLLQVLTNAGQANAATGDQGYEDAVNCATITAASLGVTPDDVLLMSTGKLQWQQAAACRPQSVA
jgi:N-acetylglutamate synthase/N-acetylornithine aminotransferase